MSNRPRLNRGETPSIFYSLFAKLFARPKAALQPILDPAWQLRDASAKSGSRQSASHLTPMPRPNDLLKFR